MLTLSSGCFPLQYLAPFLPWDLPPQPHNHLLLHLPSKGGWHTPPTSKKRVGPKKPLGALFPPMLNDLGACRAPLDMQSSPCEMHSALSWATSRRRRIALPYFSCGRRPTGKQGPGPFDGARLLHPDCCPARFGLRGAFQ
ncbi:hypothetical protein Acr_29g0012340 [Actinidia rufa]|uniref:Uncharacterized protein n=1 Tax=Actinidia rufa TaxID=165716 RepID=A0A7J0HGA1_9ERIC|nr:hypothetical protein Acr_29g0012340 [Actinidia rufa]